MAMLVSRRVYPPFFVFGSHNLPGNLIPLGGGGSGSLTQAMSQAMSIPSNAVHLDGLHLGRDFSMRFFRCYFFLFRKNVRVDSNMGESHELMGPRSF